MATVNPIAPAVPPVNNENDVLLGATALTITSGDPDANSFMAAGLPPGLSISSSGVITGTVNPFDGQNSPYTVTITDNDDGVTGLVQFQWVVNKTSPPQLSTPGNQSTLEGTTLSAANNNTVTVGVQFADANTITDKVNGVHTLPPGLSIDPNTGVITGTIGAHDALQSPYAVTISASRNGHVGQVMFTWTVTAVPPTLTSPGNQISNEGATFSTTNNTQVTVGVTGADAGTITDKVNGVDTLPPGLGINSTTGVITGTIGAYAGDNSPYTVTISASHDLQVSSITFTWTVNKTTPPVLIDPGNQVDNPLDTVLLHLKPNPNLEATSFTDLVNGQHTLPPGLTVNASGVIAGQISGSDLGNYTVTITAFHGTGKTSVQFNWLVTTNNVTTTVVLGANGSLTEFSPTASDQLISPAGSIESVSTVVDGNNVTAIYAIVTAAAGPQYANTLWENYNGMWSERSSGSFKQISATIDSNGAAVVFGVLTDGSLWQEPVSFGLDTGWVELSPAGTIQSISAITDPSGNEWCCYAIATAGDTLWLHGPAFPSGWQEISNAIFLPGERRPELVRPGAVLRLADQRRAVGAGPGPRRGRPEYRFPSAVVDRRNAGDVPERAERPAAPSRVFAIATGGLVWEESPSGVQELSPIFEASQLSATESPSGADEVFMTLIDTSLWEYSNAFPNSFEELLASGSMGTSTPLV